MWSGDSDRLGPDASARTRGSAYAASSVRHGRASSVALPEATMMAPPMSRRP